MPYCANLLRKKVIPSEICTQAPTSISLFQINGLKVQLSKTSRELVDMECTNGELKEEVETLEVRNSRSLHYVLKNYMFVHRHICTTAEMQMASAHAPETSFLFIRYGWLIHRSFNDSVSGASII
jgi:hypothetical protein